MKDTWYERLVKSMFQEKKLIDKHNKDALQMVIDFINKKSVYYKVVPSNYSYMHINIVSFKN